MWSRGVAEDALSAAARAGFEVDSIQDGVVLQSREGVIVAANEAAEAILGLSTRDLLGRDSADPRWAGSDENGTALRGEDHPPMKALATGKPVRGSILGIRRVGADASGEHVWLLVDSSPIDIVDGTPTSVVTRFRLLTGARGAELRRAEIEQLHRFMVDCGPDIAAWQLADTTFLWVSPAVTDLLGYQPEDLIGRPAYEFMHRADAALVRAEQAAEWRGPGALTQVVRLRRKDGDYVALEVRRHILRHADGKAAQMRTAWRDVSARLDAERDRDRALQRLQTVINSSPIGIALCDFEGRVQLANPALGAMLGEDADDLTGQNLNAYLTDPEHPLQLATVDDVPRYSEHEYRRRDGTTLWAWCAEVLAHAVRNDPRQVLIHLQDVTERRHRDQMLQHAALHDPLTGLKNRAGLEHAFTHGRTGRAGLIFLDIDDFKQINDVHGHHIGDEVLSDVARRITRAIRDHDHAARIGGDEFVVLCPGADEHITSLVTARLLEELSKPFNTDGRTVHVSVSTGAAATAADELSALLAVADRAMYRSKSVRRHTSDT